MCTFFGLDSLGPIAASGPQGLTCLVLLALTFVAPYALVTSEMGSAFAREAGPYVWTKLAFGRLQAAIAAILYWAANPLWIGGSLAFVATKAWSASLSPIASGSINDYTFKLLFIWCVISVGIISLRYGKWVPNLGAALRICVVALFTATTVVYGIEHGLHALSFSQLRPSGVVFLAVIPVILFNYVGFELQSCAAEEMVNPQRDVPIAVARSGVAGIVLYIVPVLSILLVLPSTAVTSLGGFLDAVNTVFGVYGDGALVLRQIMAVCFISALVTSGAVWIIGADRVVAVAASDGGFYPFFARFNPRLGTPVRVNVMTGIVASAFMITAVAEFHGGSDVEYVALLDIAVATTLISYLWIFPAALRLRHTHPQTTRPYRVPGGAIGMWIATATITFWAAVGTWMTLVPGTVEEMFGFSYKFRAAWGIDRATFEILVLMTLGVVLLVAVGGYATGRKTRAASQGQNMTPKRSDQAAGAA